MKIYRDGESLWKKDAACSKNDTWTFRVIIHRFSCSFFFARTKHSFELVNLSPSSIRARMEISTRKKGSSHCVFFDTTSSSFFFLSFSFFISKAKRIYQIHLWNCSRPKNVSPRIETLGLARHATIFSSFSLIIFYFDQKEKCLIRRGTKKRTEERNPDEKVWQEFKNQPLCPVVGATVSSKFLINLLWLSFWKHETFFHLDPCCQESIVEWIVSGRGFLWPNFFPRGLSSMFLCKTL